MKKKINKLKLLILCVTPIVVIFSVIIILNQAGIRLNSSDGYDEEDIKAGVQKLKELEKKDVASVQEDIDKAETPLNKTKEEENKTGKKDYSKIFKSSVIMGDSRSEGFDEYNFLGKMSVVAKKGSTAKQAAAQIGETINIAPKNLFMNYGLNDVESYKRSEDFIKYYMYLVKEVKSKLPNTKIYIVSIFPTMEKAAAKQPDYNNINNFNKSLQEMCKENDLIYVDATGLLKGKDDLYEPDGIHFKAKFYPVWLDFLAKKANL